jgi:hypothetical protein
MMEISRRITLQPNHSITPRVQGVKPELNGMFSPAMQVQPKPKVAADLPLIRKVNKKKDLGNCFLSPLLFCSTEGGTRTHTLLPELDFESSASAIPPLRLGKLKTPTWEII